MARHVHPTAVVDPRAQLGDEVTVWQFAQIREHAQLGPETSVGMGCYVDVGVQLGARCKLQGHVSTFQGLVVEDGVFIGPGAVFTNDLHPRALNADGSLRREGDWVQRPTRVEQGASIGANATVLCGVRLGAHCMVGAGSVVSRDVPSFGLVRGNPARLVGFVGRSGLPLDRELARDETTIWLGRAGADEEVAIPLEVYRQLPGAERA